MPFTRGSEGEEGNSIPGRAKSTFKGPEVGKALVYWRNQYNADRCSEAEPVAQRPSNFVKPTHWKAENPGVCPAPPHPPCFRACSLLGVCLREEVRMDHLSGLERLGHGWQDVECIYFLFTLEVCFPANTCLTATHLSRGSQRQHSIGHEQSCKNKPASFVQTLGASQSGLHWPGGSALGNNLVLRKGGKKNNFKFQAPRASYRRPLSGEGKTKLCEGAWWRLWEGKGYR